MNDFLLRRRVLAALGAAPLALAGCATDPGTSGGPVLAEAPAYRVGDRWTYLVDSQFRAVPDVDEVVEIVAVRADSIEARVTTKLSPADVTRTERWSAPGLVLQGALMDNETRRFREPLQRFRFPLAGGDRWNQWVDQVNDTQGTAGRINRFVSVRGLDRVTVPAGTFDAVRMNVVMLLDDDPFMLEMLHAMFDELGSFDVQRESDARRALRHGNRALTVRPAEQQTVRGGVSGHLVLKLAAALATRCPREAR